MLVYYNNAYQPHLLRETGDRSATGIMKDDLLMLNLFPEVPADSYSSRNEIVFVIDRSGISTSHRSLSFTSVVGINSVHTDCIVPKTTSCVLLIIEIQ